MPDLLEHQHGIMCAVNDLNRLLKAAAGDGYPVHITVSEACPEAGRDFPIISTLRLRKPKEAA